MFKVAVTVTLCEPTVAALLVQTDIRPLAAVIVNSAAVRLTYPLAGELVTEKVIAPQNPVILYATLVPSRTVGAY